MLLWETKETSSGTTYTPRKSPSSYKIDWEDLDNNSYRSKNSGNLIDTVISKSWAKISFSYNCLTEAEIQALLPLLANNPLYVKAKNPVFGNEYVEMEMRCSRKSAEMLETGDYTLSFNLVQKKKVSGQ
jgi:hypothetical protein